MAAKRNRFFPLSRIIILVIGTVVVMYALHLYYAQKHKLLLYKKEIEDLKKENAKLEKILMQVDTPYMTEKIAREQLGMMKQGEYKINLKEGKNVSH
ncbi:MAG: septum formation initiator family protein [Candidatus Omnitrophica bacterium]|nr:septum formation initiator family protein [Candidatus Omnitrophota bacterium]